MIVYCFVMDFPMFWYCWRSCWSPYPCKPLPKTCGLDDKATMTFTLQNCADSKCCFFQFPPFSLASRPLFPEFQSSRIISDHDQPESWCVPIVGGQIEDQRYITSEIKAHYDPPGDFSVVLVANRFGVPEPKPCRYFSTMGNPIQSRWSWGFTTATSFVDKTPCEISPWRSSICVDYSDPSHDLASSKMVWELPNSIYIWCVIQLICIYIYTHYAYIIYIT